MEYDKKETEAFSRNIRKEVKQFVESTSLKGAPRIVKSHNRCVRVFWFLVVALMLSATIYFTTQLIMEYLEYRTTMSISEYTVENDADRNKLEERYDFSFPSVTICNEQPFKSDYDVSLPDGILDQLNFEGTLTQHLRSVNVSNAVRQELHEYAYLTYLASYPGLVDLEQLGQTYDDFVIACSYITANQNENSPLECRSVGDVYYVIAPHSLSCQTIGITENDAVDVNDIIGLTAVLYLDSFSTQLSQESFDVMSKFGRSSGIDVATHRRGTRRQTFDARTSVAPGQNVKLEVKTSGRHALPKPYSDCVETGRQLYNLFGIKNPYSQQGCMMACKQQRIINSCHCIYPPFYLFFTSIPYWEYGLPLCTWFNLNNVGTVVQMTQCALDVAANSRQHCYERCKPKCARLEYTHKHSATHWPAKNTQLAFYNSVIRVNDNTTDNTTSRWKRWQNFAPVYEPIRDAYLAGNETQALDMLKASSLIEDNFIKVEILFSTKPVMAFESKEALNGVSFMSLLGGTLNLYAGITFVLLFELTELMVKLCQNGYKRYKQQQSAVSPSAK